MGPTHLVLIATGGTISSAGISGSISPKFSAEDLLAMARSSSYVPSTDIEVRAEEFSRVLSAHMHPEIIYRLAVRIKQVLEDDEVAGVVVTHGTGTMEETSFMVDLYHSSPKPVVFTGAMRPVTDPGTDGLRNLHDAVVVASDGGAQGKGVLLVMNGVILGARDAAKFHSSALDSFRSESGPLGTINPAGRPSFFRSPIRRQTFPLLLPEANVDLIRFCVGMDGRFIRASMKCGARGLVVEGSGLGNVNWPFSDALKEAVQQGIIVAMASRCPTGTAYPMYDFPGAGADLARSGVLFSAYLSGLKCRLLLCVALAHTQDRQHLAAILDGQSIDAQA